MGRDFFRFPIFSHYFPICPRIRVNSYLESPLRDRLGTGFLNCVPFRPIAAFPAVWVGYAIAGAGRHKSGNNAINTAIEGDIWNTCSYDIEGQEAWQEATAVKIFKCDSFASDSYHKVFEGVPPLNSALEAQNNLRNVKNRDIRSKHIETGPVLCFLHVPIKPRVCGYCPQEHHPGVSPRADGGAGIRHTGAFRGRAVSVEGEMFHRLPIVAIAALGIAAFLGIASLFVLFFPFLPGHRACVTPRSARGQHCKHLSRSRRGGRELEGHSTAEQAPHGRREILLSRKSG